MSITRRTMVYGDSLLGVNELGVKVPGAPSYVLVHGIGVSSRYFMALARELARVTKVYVLDLPGFGPMPKPNRSLNISDYARIVEAFIRDERLNNTVLVGNSMGCQIVTEMFVLNPSLEARAVLIGPVVNNRERSFWKQTLRLFQDGFHEPPHVNWMIFTDYFRCGPRWYFKVFPHMLAYPMEQNVSKIGAQTLIIRGENDPIAPSVWAKKLTHAAHGKLIEIPGAGHIVMHKKAKHVAAYCLDV